MAVGLKRVTDSETLDTSPGGLFTNPDDVTAIDLSTVESHLQDAIDGARNAKGWAVGSDSAPLDGWTITNNSKAYSEAANASAIAADQSATQAATSATAANASAIRAEQARDEAAASATTATQQAEAAATSAAAALASETAAANSAGAAAMSATDAAASRDAAAESAREADSDLRAIEPIISEIRTLREEIRMDSEEIAMLQQEIAHDSEEIASALVEIRRDSEEVARASQLAEAYATGDGMRAGEGISRDRPTLGQATLGSGDFTTFSGTQYVRIPFGGFEGANLVSGTLNYDIDDILNDTSKTITLYQNYEFGGTLDRNDFFDIFNNELSLVRTNISEWNTPPVAGDIVHVFVTDSADSEIPTYESAYFQALAGEFFAAHSLQLEMRVDSEVTGFNARIDSEKVVRARADSELQAEIDSDVAALRGDIRNIIDSDIRHIHARINEVVVVGYGLDYIEADSDIIVDSDVIASVRKLDSEIFAARAYTDQEIAALIGASPGIYTTLTRIREALDSDETVLDGLVAYMDSDRMAREQLAADLRADVDSDATAIRAVGARIDSEQIALRADIDSDAIAIRRLDGRIDSEKVVRAAEDTVLNNRIDSEIRNLHRRVSGVVDVGYGLQYNTTDSDIFVDSDVIASRRFVDSEIDAIRATLDSEGGARGSFRSLTDTPNSYEGQAGNYPRVNADSDAIEFTNPFPVASNNRLTELNGLRIRTIGSNFIEFVSFAPTQRINAQTLNWDQPVTGFGVTYTNNDDFQDEFINRVSNFQVGTTPITGFNTVPGFTSSGTITSSSTFLSNQAWDGSSDTFAMTSNVLSNLNNSFAADGANLTWRGWSAGTSTDIGGQLFDTVDTSYVARLTINNTTDITNNVSNALFTPANAQSGSAAQSAATTGTTTSVTFSGLSILSNTRLQGTVTGTATKPATVLQEGVDSDYGFSHTWDATPTTQHRVWFIVASSTPTFATPGNGGYTNPTGTIVRNDNTISLARGRNQYGNGQTGVNLYVIGNGTINSIQETTNVDFPIAQTVPTPTQLTLGHTGNTYNYNVYTIPLADNAGNFYTIT